MTKKDSLHKVSLEMAKLVKEQLPEGWHFSIHVKDDKGYSIFLTDKIESLIYEK